MSNASRASNTTHLARNAVWNLGGAIIPILATIVSTPMLIQGLGTDRFGLIVLSWAIVGYLSVFDFGLGRTLTQSIASRLETHSVEDIAAIFRTSLMLLCGFGVVGAVLGIFLTQTVLLGVVDVPDNLVAEAQPALILLCLSLPVVITSAALRGTLEAFQQFRSLSILRTGLGLFSSLAPLAVLPFTKNIAAIVAVLVVGRIANWLLHWILCVRHMPELRTNSGFDRSLVRPLLKSGGWMTVSNVVSPLLTSLDRFLIATWVSVSAVTFYTTPYDALMSSLVVPTAIAGVMFPAFAAMGKTQRDRTANMFRRSAVVTYIVMLPVSLGAILFAKDVLQLWLGGEFADRSTVVLQILAMGVLANSLAQVPFSLIQGLGRPDITAKLHLLELPLYVILLAVLVTQWGIKGAAIAWTIRVCVDFSLLIIIAGRTLDIFERLPSPMAVSGIGIPLLMLPFAAIPDTLVTKGLFLVAALAVHGTLALATLFSQEERSGLFHVIRSLTPLARSETLA
jgi:O-antigen/teichoic acid export membrane protein